MTEKFTIIIPIYNEIDAIFPLLDEINKEFSLETPEIIIVDDGSNDNFLKKFDKTKKYKNTTVKRHKKNLGKSAAMITGVKSAKNNILIFMDGDGQNPPSEARKLINKWHELKRGNKKSFLVCGNRIKRKDNLIKRLSSRFANSLRKYILNDNCNDTACALKALEKKDYLKLKYFRNMHRFLPALFIMKNIEIINLPVKDRPRTLGKSKFNFHNRFWVGIVDLVRVWNLIRKERN